MQFTLTYLPQISDKSSCFALNIILPLWYNLPEKNDSVCYTFLIPTPQVLQKIITGLDDLYEHDISDLDMQGDLYEYMLGKLSTAGQNGQFRTPKHIREMMVELLRPTPDDLICENCTTSLIRIAAA